MAFDGVKAARILKAAENIKSLCESLNDSVRTMYERQEEGPNGEPGPWVALNDVTLGDMAETYVLLDMAYGVIDDARKKIYAHKEHLSHNKVPEILGAQGLKSFNTETGYRVTVSYLMSAKILDQKKGFEWIRLIDAGDAIKESINHQTLSAIVREQMNDHGREPPAEAISTSVAPYTSVTKIKPSNRKSK